MIRFRVPDDQAAAFQVDAEEAHRLLSVRAGYVGGELGRNLDDPTLWVLTTRWADVGSYRRALSSYDVKLGAVPLLSRALDEPSAYELATDDLNRAGARGTALSGVQEPVSLGIRAGKPAGLRP
ncbi:MAG TPA: antibiotic biosynthesis monooxygenase [Marmoricola sp.]|nr:antibiotic biosynthesis monooxygenase [Marmoricola sp.]